MIFILLSNVRYVCDIAYECFNNVFISLHSHHGGVIIKLNNKKQLFNGNRNVDKNDLNVKQIGICYTN